MPRPQKRRKVCIPPQMLGFKPYGIEVCNSEHIIMQYDEYEAIKLVEYDNFSQDKAAAQMDVSRPTLTRIYNNALKKIAKAFVEGTSIHIEGGNIELDKDWYKCTKCYKLIDGLENHVKCEGCNRFGLDELEQLNKS